VKAAGIAVATYVKYSNYSLQSVLYECSQTLKPDVVFKCDDCIGFKTDREEDHGRQSETKSGRSADSLTKSLATVCDVRHPDIAVRIK
jgi:hypothetical protein